MKYFLAGFALIVTAGMLVSQQDGPEKDKSAVPKPQRVPAIRFNPNSTAIVGASGDTIAVAVSADGKRIASIGNALNPSSGYLSVIEVPSKKELLSIRVSRPTNSVGISPDGKSVAFASQLGDLKLLGTDSGKTLFSKKLDGSARVAFAPDGRSLATITQAKTVQIWDVPSGEEMAKLFGATTPLLCVAISPDGKKLAAGGGDQRQDNLSGTIYVWDIATQRLLRKLESNAPALVWSIAFSPNSTHIAGASFDNQVRIWDVVNGQMKTVLMPEERLFGLAFSPAERTLAGVMGGGTIQLWNADSGAEIGVLTGKEEDCRCVAFSEGGKKIVTGGNPRSVKLWDVASKREIATLRQDERIASLPVPLAMAATSDNSLIALATEDRGVILRDSHSGEIKATLKGHEDAVTCVAFSPDGKTLATGSADKTIKLWDLATNQARATLRGHSNWVYAIAFSHDGKTLASGGYDKTLRLWDAQTGQEKGTIPARGGAVRAVAFSPDDTTIASGGSDRLVKLWNLPGGELKFAIQGHEGAVRTLAFSTDGKTLASGDEDGFVKLWDPAAGTELVATTKEHTEVVTVVAFAGERTVLSGGSDGTIRQWDAATGEMIGAFKGHQGGVSGIAVATGGGEFLSTGADRIVKRFRQATSGPVHRFAGHTGVVQWVSFSPDGRRFVSCGNWPEGDKTLRIWDLEKQTEILQIKHPGQAANALFSPDGRSIASASGDSHAYLWDATTGDLLCSFTGHKAGVNGLAFNADGSRLLTSGADKTVRVWDTTTLREVQKFTGHTDMVRRIVVHPDGKHVLSASHDGFVRMWELATAKQVRVFKSSDRWANCVAVSKDGKVLATGGNSLDVFDIETGKKLIACIGHQGGVTHAAFSADGKRILSSSYDGTARLWDRETGQELYRFRDHREVLWVAAFSPDGKWILTGGGGARNNEDTWSKGIDHDVRLWRMPDEKAIAVFSSER